MTLTKPSELYCTMAEEIREMQRLLSEVADDLKQARQASRRRSIGKLRRIAALAETLALTLEMQQSK